MPTVELEEAVRRLADDPSSTGLFTDFDGTLSPIVPEASAARPLPAAAEALHALARILAKVAVVSGRPARFLAERLSPEPGEPLELFGLHGLEHWTGESAEPVAAAKAFAEHVARATATAEEAAIEGLAVEDKVFGLTLHWRNANDKVTTGKQAMELAESLASCSGLLIRPGKASVELVPPVGIDKGTVVREEGQGLAAVAFLGDDVGDVRAFEALDFLADKGAETLRVAVNSSEAPGELLERADLVLPGPEAAAELLGMLVSRLSRRN